MTQDKQPSSGSNPDELQEVYLSDDDIERMMNNYATQQELKDFNPDKVDWQPMNQDPKNDSESDSTKPSNS